MSGNTTGKSVDELSEEGLSFLNISTPNIISIEIINKTIAPATAKAEISTWNNFKSHSPTNRKPIKIINEYNVAFSGCIDLFWLLIFKKMGTDPGASIIANNTKNALIISRILIFMNHSLFRKKKVYSYNLSTKIQFYSILSNEKNYILLLTNSTFQMKMVKDEHSLDI